MSLLSSLNQHRILLAFVVICAAALSATFTLAAVDTSTVEPMPAAVAPKKATRRTIDQGVLVAARVKAGRMFGVASPTPRRRFGDLRLACAASAPRWDGERDATAYHSRCLQMPLFYSGKAFLKDMLGDEDCLYLNIAAPADALKTAKTNGPLPVYVRIHGGGNVWGAAHDHRGEIFAARQDIIFVSMNYRLGVLGWFAHAALRDTALTQADRAANFGHLDQIAALKWIQDNYRCVWR